jgi:hypothetical protein
MKGKKNFLCLFIFFNRIFFKFYFLAAGLTGLVAFAPEVVFELVVVVAVVGRVIVAVEFVEVFGRGGIAVVVVEGAGVTGDLGLTVAADDDGAVFAAGVVVFAAGGVGVGAFAAGFGVGAFVADAAVGGGVVVVFVGVEIFGAAFFGAGVGVGALGIGIVFLAVGGGVVVLEVVVGFVLLLLVCCCCFNAAVVAVLVAAVVPVVVVAAGFLAEVGLEFVRLNAAVDVPACERAKSKSSIPPVSIPCSLLFLYSSIATFKRI